MGRKGSKKGKSAEAETGSFSFADGHSEIRKWLSKTTKVPVKYGWGTPTFDSNGKLDYQWWKERTGFVKY